MSAPEPSDFEEYVAARRGALLRTAYLLTGDLHDAEDLLQVALARSLPHWRRIADRPEPYVRRVMTRESISRWRARRWRERPTSSPPERPGGDSGESTAESRLVILNALAALSPRQRAVVVLRYYEDLTEAETARLLGISVGTVKSHTRDALANLRTSLPEADELLA